MNVRTLISNLVLDAKFTGSRVMKVGTVRSDYDYLIDKETYNRVALPFVDLLEFRESFDQSGDTREWDGFTFYIDSAGRTYNFIVHENPVTLNAWCLTTDIMCLLPKCILADKKRRIATFIFLCELLVKP